MATKATHTGTCQVCDHHQKLPGGKLSLHGYTTRFGFFEGTCFGSKELPFEVSIHLILTAIERAKESAKNLRANAKLQVAEASAASAWWHLYVPAERHGRATIPSHYRWVRVELTKNASDQTVAVVDGKVEPLHRYGYSPAADPQALAVLLAQKYAAHLEDQAEKADAYVVWQQERINGWAPKPLKALADAAPKKLTTRTRGARVSAYLGRNSKNEAIRVEGLIVDSYRNGFWTEVVVKTDDGKIHRTRQSFCSLVK